jgi:dipeptidase
MKLQLPTNHSNTDEGLAEYERQLAAIDWKAVAASIHFQEPCVKDHTEEETLRVFDECDARMAAEDAMRQQLFERLYNGGSCDFLCRTNDFRKAFQRGVLSPEQMKQHIEEQLQKKTEELRSLKAFAEDFKQFVELSPFKRQALCCIDCKAAKSPLKEASGWMEAALTGNLRCTCGESTQTHKACPKLKTTF